MSSEHDALEVFERANPVPDPELLDIEPDASRFLADLLHDDPTVIRIEPADGHHVAHRRRWLLPALAAAVIAFVIAGLVLVVRGDSTGQAPADTTPATIPDNDADVDAPVTTPPETVTATSPTTTPTPTSQPVPITAPPGQSSAGAPLVESGETSASPVGDITWTRIDGDTTNLPQSVAFEHDGSFYGVDPDGTSWRSDDRITWTEIDPFPGQRSGYAEIGDDVWTVIEPDRPDEPIRLGRWDGTSFVPIDLPEFVTSDVPGLRVVDRFAGIQSFRNELFVDEGARYGIDPATDIMEFGDDVDMTDVSIQWVDDDTYRVFTTMSGIANQFGPDLTVAAEPDDTGVVLITSPDDTVVGRVGPWPGLDAAQLLEGLRNGGLEQRRLLIGDDDGGFDTLPNPPNGGGVSDLVDVDGRVLALVAGGTDGSRYSLWQVDDLANWDRIPEIPIAEPGTIRGMSLVGNDDGVTLYILIDPPMHAETWFTADGTTWQPTNAPTDWGDVTATDLGWFRSSHGLSDPESGSTSGYSVWVSGDGTDWHPIRLDIDPPRDGGGTWSSALANTIFVIHQDGADRTIWVGEVQIR